MIKICEECGKEFEARTCKQRFCKGPHIQVCAICGKKFEYICSPVDKPHTCSKQCKQKYMEQQLLKKYGVTNVSQIEEVRKKKHVSNASEESQNKLKQTCLERYGVEHANQSPEVRKKISDKLKSSDVQNKRKSAFQKHFGVDHIFMLPDYRERYGCNKISTLDSTKKAVKRALMKKYGVDNIANIPGVSERAQKSREATCLERYGENCIFKTKQFKKNILVKYGTNNVMHNKDVLKRAMRNKQNKSNLEIRLHNFLEAYDIEYQEEYPITSNSLGHSYDVYLPKYKILIDCDGEYWHSYLSDPDGQRVRDDGDAVRLALVPEDHIFYLIVESDFERGIRGLQKIIQSIDANIFDYDSEVFKWCRQVGFPYYNYSEERLKSDWDKLCKDDSFGYDENRMFGISIINQFHRSIFDCHVKGTVSPKEGWENDDLLKKVIANRLIYVNKVDPSKVLKGLNISKTATKVSVFNPMLALYLCKKYLQNYQEVCDPFSGFSGRLLGCIAAGKQYFGKDINEDHVRESNKIIDFLNISSAEVVRQDILISQNNQFDSLLTCPPYSDKEVYGQESEFHSCDEWIDITLDKYDCNRYIFVVDHTDKYRSNIIEELKYKSYFRKSSEYVIVIDR